MVMPAASMREYAFGLMKANFHRPHHLLSALSQAIPPYFERNTYKNLIQNKHAIRFHISLGFLQARGAVVYL